MPTTYYFIRHAEKEFDGTYNPSLTEKGRKRAIHWSRVLGDKGINKIYCTPLIRTRQTAEPLAKKLGITMDVYDPSDLYSGLFRMETKGKTALIVGHQDTTPAFINRILKEKKYRFIKASNHANLYKVIIEDDGTIKDELWQEDL